MIAVTAAPTSTALLNKSCPPAFPPSQFLGSGFSPRFSPRNWEDGKAGGQDLFNKVRFNP
jgi:hypothetical protein